MTGYATYKNESVKIVKIIDTGIAAGQCQIVRPNGQTEWVFYKNLTIHSWKVA